MRLLQDHPQRMAQEFQQLESHGRATPSFTMHGWSSTETGELCLKFELKFLNATFAGVLVYPELFPDVPAFIRPQKEGEVWSSHQYKGSGVLCLQYGPDNWHRDITGVQLVQSANSLIWGELLNGLLPQFGPVPSRHEETLSLRSRDSAARLLVSQALKAVLSGSGRLAHVAITGVVDWRGAESVALVLQTGNPLVAVEDVPGTVAEGAGVPFGGMAVAVPSIESLLDSKDATDLQVRLGNAWPWEQGIGDKLQMLLVHDERGRACAFLLKSGATSIFNRYLPLDSEANDEGHCMDLSRPKRLPPNYARLSEVSVALVGLGSLGSKIAVSLARSGVRNFVLVDDDVLMPENLVRNEFNWLEVGFTKLEATARAVKLVAADVQVSKWPMQVASQGNPAIEAMLAEKIATCTLVVDATANSSAFLALAAITKRAGTAMVWGEVFGGGGGALMARSSPGLDIDALGIREHLHGVLEGLAPTPEAQFSGYGLVAEGKIYVASDADVSHLAATMTQFCLDTLSNDQSEYPVAAYLIGFRKFWEFRCPFDVIPVDCPRKPEAVSAPTLTGQEQAALTEIQNAIQGGSPCCG